MKEATFQNLLNKYLLECFLQISFFFLEILETKYILFYYKFFHSLSFFYMDFPTVLHSGVFLLGCNIRQKATNFYSTSIYFADPCSHVLRMYALTVFLFPFVLVFQLSITISQGSQAGLGYYYDCQRRTYGQYPFILMAAVFFGLVGIIFLFYRITSNRNRDRMDSGTYLGHDLQAFMEM